MNNENFPLDDERIGFFVHSGEFYWIVDWEAHFNIDQRKNIDAMCSKPQYLRFKPEGISVDQWRDEMYREFREGIPNMTSETFFEYLRVDGVKLLTTNDLRLNFFSNDVDGKYKKLSDEMERELSFGVSMSDVSVQLRIDLSKKLPKFYVNFDRKIFMHMVRGRSYEGAVSDGWWARQGDFEHMIPVQHRYWLRTMEEDFWALTNFSNYD